MTYANVVKRGWFCKCEARTLHKLGFDSWEEWKICNQCRLPIKNSNRVESQRLKGEQKRVG